MTRISRTFSERVMWRCTRAYVHRMQRMHRVWPRRAFRRYATRRLVCGRGK